MALSDILGPLNIKKKLNNINMLSGSWRWILIGDRWTLDSIGRFILIVVISHVTRG